MTTIYTVIGQVEVEETLSQVENKITYNTLQFIELTEIIGVDVSDSKFQTQLQTILINKSHIILIR